MAVATPIVYQTSEEVDCGARGRKGVGGARWEAAEVGGCGGKGKARVGSVIEVGKVGGGSATGADLPVELVEE